MSISSILMRPRLTWGLCTGLALAALCVGIFTMPTRGARADGSVNLDVHDLPQAGLTLISAADASFDQLLNNVPLLPGLAPLRDKLKPFSVFVSNRGDKGVVAFRIVWMVPNAVGQERPRIDDVGKAASLMERWNQPPGPGGDSRQYVIAQGASQFVSLLPVPLEDPNGAPLSFVAGGSFPGVPRVDPANQNQNTSPADRVAATAARYIELETQQLARSSRISVSIDGAVFEDGSFVGPDETGYFSRLQAEIKAKHDLFQEFLNMLNAGQPDADVDARLTELTGSKLGLALSSTPDEQYKGFKSMFARQISLVWQKLGRQGTLDFLNARLSHPWATLYKRQ